jgi:hypothetical protein
MEIPPKASSTAHIVSENAGVVLYVDRMESAFSSGEGTPFDVIIFARFIGKPFDCIPSVTILRENDWVLVDWYSTRMKLYFISAKITGSTKNFKFIFGTLPDVPKTKSHLRKFNNLITEDV